MPRNLKNFMITQGSKVKIHYTLRVDGQIVDSSTEGGPLEYQHGSGQIIPGLERALEGLAAGDSRQVHIGPEDAYGPIRLDAVLEIPREQLRNIEVQEGTVLSGRDESGKTVRGIVRKIGEDKVTVDFNHPFAGKELFFEIQIIEVSG